MLLHAFYNLEGSGDVLLVRLGSGTTSVIETVGDLVVLKDAQKTIGYNLLNASKHFDKLGNGKIEITPDFVEKLNNILKSNGLEEVSSDFNDHFIVGKVVECELHPDSDHLHICQVDKGYEQVQIVCGAKNIAKDQLVVVAEENAVMPSGLIIKPSKLRGQPSAGMICSSIELNLLDIPYEGILVLDENLYSVGENFYKRYGELNV
ncbi:MAG: DUF4479 domain-containing protein [Erysipelotrichaceae bacterium]|nr:DUF4479 domain-containing protein [Erysipelotrichaceae bacterium]